MRHFLSSRGWSLGLGVALALAGCADPATRPIVISDPARIEVVAPADLPVDLATAFGRQMAEERRRVQDWWGTPYPGPIRVRITDDVRVAMAMIPTWHGHPGLIEIPTARVHDGTAASLHELVHIHAPNGNRLLGEGLAVHGHDLLGGVAAFPNYHRPLHRLARRFAGQFSLVELERIAVPKGIALGDRRRGAYLIAGSFVRFLIERHGMAQFRTLYAMTPLVPGKRDAGAVERWQTVYGEPLVALERDWRTFLENAK